MSDSPASTPTHIGHIQAEAMPVAELLDAAAAGPVLVTRPFGAEPVLVSATPADAAPVVVSVIQAIRAAGGG